MVKPCLRETQDALILFWFPNLGKEIITRPHSSMKCSTANPFKLLMIL